MALSITSYISEIDTGKPRKASPIKNALQAVQDWASAGLTTADLAANAGILLSQLEMVPLQWLIQIDVRQKPHGHTNWEELVEDVASISLLYGWAKQSTGAQNAEIYWDVLLAAGTWQVDLIHSKDTNRGIYSIRFDDVEKATIDGYAASASLNVITSTGDITVATTAKVRFKLKMATKHASSTGYFGTIEAVQLRRTA